MLQISNHISLTESEIEITAVRSQGPGGQHVNKVASAVHLRFDIVGSSLPDTYKTRLLQKRDRRITKEGVVIIKAQTYRSLEKNKEEALKRLREIIKGAVVCRKKRKATKPTRSSKEKRLAGKAQRGRTKTLRGKVDLS